MEFGTLLEILDKHGQHAFSLVVIVQLYLFGRELKQHHKELKKHREDEELTRKELITIGTAVAVLLDRDKRDITAVKDVVEDAVREAVEEISGVHPKVEPSQLSNDDGEPAEPPAPRPPRAPSRPGAPGEYAFLRPASGSDGQRSTAERAVVLPENKIDKKGGA